MKAGLVCLPFLAAAANIQGAPLDPPTPETVAEARQIVQEMRNNPRGPYSRIRWYCNDGSVQPPVAYACRERGGGRQHAEYSGQRERLAGLGWSVGTIFAALSFEELMQSQSREGRLRELPLERYLVDIDNGWVLQRAKDYRGRVQVEDETSAGRELLRQVLAREAWALENFLLVRETARTIPHGAESDLARTVRRDAVQLAEMDPAAETWRAEIHSRPARDTAPRLAAWAARRQQPEVAAFATELARNLDLLYGQSGRQARIDQALAAVRKSPAGAAWAQAVSAAMREPAAGRIAPVCGALQSARAEVFARLGPDGRVALLDAMQELESVVPITFQEHLATAPLQRHQLLALSSALADCAYASGLLSDNERRALRSAVTFDDATTISLADYRRAVATLKRAPGWALGTVRHTFAEALIDYTALDSRAARFSDDLLRESPLWPFGVVLKQLVRDADSLAGSVTDIAGEPVAAVALNPGMARGTLRIFETLEAVEHAVLQPSDVVVLPEAVAELSPVAGILTLGEGNALSHVQLLARNFGIPNVAIDFESVDRLRSAEGKEVLLLAGSEGDVLLRQVDPELAGSLDASRSPAADADLRVEVPLPDLSVDRVLPLGAIGRELSGKVVGPKAANLGELNRLFPGRVAPVVALPFGIYAAHLRSAALEKRIEEAFAARDRGELTSAAFDEEMASIRKAIAALVLETPARDHLEALMAREFGEPGSYGVFVRSDTNVEDLPQFTGAGLNETVPNVVGLERQLVAIPRVWSSILSPRALAWRSSVLANPARIYASVLLMKSVPSTKSGVLVTSNLIDRGAPGLTVSAAWGVGGAVAGEAAETIVILPDEKTMLVSEAKAPYKRHLAAAGGVDWLPAKAGPVLDTEEVAALRALAAEVESKYEPTVADDGTLRPWDIEFGFIDGELTLFQIRPLVERTVNRSDALLRRLMPATTRAPVAAQVALSDLPLGVDHAQR